MSGDDYASGIYYLVARLLSNNAAKSRVVKARAKAEDAASDGMADPDLEGVVCGGLLGYCCVLKDGAVTKFTTLAALS